MTKTQTSATLDDTATGLTQDQGAYKRYAKKHPYRAQVFEGALQAVATQMVGSAADRFATPPADEQTKKATTKMPRLERFKALIGHQSHVALVDRLVGAMVLHKAVDGTRYVQSDVEAQELKYHAADDVSARAINWGNEFDEDTIPFEVSGFIDARSAKT